MSGSGRAIRVLCAATDAAVACGFLEAVGVVARVSGARTVGTAAALTGATALAALALTVPVSALGLLVPLRSARVRGALAAALGLGALAAFYVDATFYVRLYGAEHELLGVSLVVAVALARALFVCDARATSVGRLAVFLAASSLGTVWFLRSENARAVAAHRGVLLADTLWALRPDATSLPPMPRLPGVVAGPPARPLPTPPRLILLVTIDALRYDSAQRDALRTLSLVRSRAVRFEAAHTTAAWTVPALYGLFTGLGPWRAKFTPTRFFGEKPVPYTGADRNPRRVWPLPIEDRARTLAEALRQAGYQTRVCTTLPFQVPEGGLVRGFDVVEQGVYLRRNHDLRGITSDLLTACALSMLEAAGDKPLFLWLHYSDPHEPYLPHPDEPPVGDGPRGAYEGEVAFVDFHLGGLLSNVHRRLGMANTLLVVTADHGEEFGEHGGNYHAVTLYEEIAHVPLLILAPGFAPHSVATAVSLLDVAPTILELVGAPPLEGAEGRSLVGALAGETLPARPVFAESVRYGRAVRMVLEGDTKLVYEGRARTYELFSLSADPTEQFVTTDSQRPRVDALAQRIGVPLLGAR